MRCRNGRKGKEMEKGNKTGQEKKIQRMVNDLIKMAERRADDNKNCYNFTDGSVLHLLFCKAD